jgi:hypothetical protein
VFAYIRRYDVVLLGWAGAAPENANSQYNRMQVTHAVHLPARSKRPLSAPLDIAEGRVITSARYSTSTQLLERQRQGESDGQVRVLSDAQREPPIAIIRVRPARALGRGSLAQ